MSELEEPKRTEPEVLELASGGVLLRQPSLAAPSPRRKSGARQLPPGSPAVS